MKYKITKQANLDIQKVLEYTKIKWGFYQAEKYGSLIFSKFSDLDQLPFMGVEADYIVPGARKLVLESHMIIYFIKPEGVVILRFLHCSVDTQNINPTAIN